MASATSNNREFPKNFRASDGMVVTADVWNKAHDFHNQILGLHIQANHGAGIITGLEHGFIIESQKWRKG